MDLNTLLRMERNEVRIAFVLLIVANIAFFAWQNLTSTEKKAVTPKLPEAVEGNALPVTLLAEIAQQGGQELRLVAESASGLMLGGFDSIEQANALRQRLLSLSIDGNAVEHTEELAAEYLVYLPAGESKRLALRKIDELQINGVNAVYVDKGILDNIIQFDVFKNELEARALVDRLKQLGYFVKIERTSRAKTSYWIAIEAYSERLVDEQVLEVLSRDFKDLQRRYE